MEIEFIGAFNMCSAVYPSILLIEKELQDHNKLIAVDLFCRMTKCDSFLISEKTIIKNYYNLLV